MDLIRKLAANTQNIETSGQAMLGFSQNPLETASETRTANCLSGALEADDTVYIISAATKILVAYDRPDGNFSARDLDRYFPQESMHHEEAILLGAREGRHYVNLPVEADEDDTRFSFLDGRSALYGDGLEPDTISMFGMSISLRAWYNENRFCGKCGGKTKAALGGMRLDCQTCASTSFPRTDPVVIMLAIHENKCLLGRGPQFPEGWYSCLAGFVEPGETMEMAVRREVHEESGIETGEIAYYTSQPWPFPHSLMLGCYADAKSTKINFDSNELEDCRWFEREEVMAMIEKRHKNELRMPPSRSIAAHLIRNWIATI